MLEYLYYLAKNIEGGIILPNSDSSPEILYKYKSIAGNSLEHFLDTIYNHQIYAATVQELNDPFEGFQQLPEGMGYAGVSFYSGTPIPYSVMNSALENYRVISFTENLDNPLMWIHYANNFSGVCIGFRKNPLLQDAFKLSYYEKLDRKSHHDYPDATTLFEEGLHQKWKGWNYEKEWRYLTKHSNEFLKFTKSDISEICIGYKMQPNIRKAVTTICKQEGYHVNISFIDPLSCKVEIQDIDEYETRLKSIGLKI